MIVVTFESLIYKYVFSCYFHCRMDLPKGESLKGLRNSVPKCTQNKTRWGVSIFEAWKEKGAIAMHEKNPRVWCIKYRKSYWDVNHECQDLIFRLSKFLQEARDKDSEKYSQKTIKLYQLICCIVEENCRAEINPFNSENHKYVIFVMNV